MKVLIKICEGDERTNKTIAREIYALLESLYADVSFTTHVGKVSGEDHDQAVQDLDRREVAIETTWSSRCAPSKRRRPQRRPSVCGRVCNVSTGIHEGLTFGRGKLDDHGFWEFGCRPCARRHEEEHPEDGPCWPFAPETSVTGNDKEKGGEEGMTIKRVFVMSGVSGVGKSTWVKNHVQEWVTPETSTTIVSADSFFIDRTGEYHFDPEGLSEAHASCFRAFIGALEARIDHVLVDNTNTTVEEISPYMLGAAAFGYEAQINTLDIDWKDCFRAASRNVHGVDLETVLNQHKRIRARVLPPWWKHTTILGEV